jgi:DNA-binding beta-propeller fold protein YncE
MPAAGVNAYTSCNEQDDTNSSHTKLNEPADVTVDPDIGPVSHKKGDVYIADGYGNHRIVVFDAEGKYVGQWGTTCKIDGKPTNSEACAPGTFGATGGGHPHCVVLGNDGLVYVCDRPNNRIQVFDRKCAVPSTPTNREPVCPPVRIIPINGFEKASPGNQKAIALGEQRATDIDFWPVPAGHADTAMARQDLIVDVDLGNDNAWLIDKRDGHVVGALGACGLSPCPGHGAGHFAFGHMIATDSKGNIYVGETITGRRIQKFVPQDH